MYKQIKIIFNSAVLFKNNITNSILCRMWRALLGTRVMSNAATTVGSVDGRVI